MWIKICGNTNLEDAQLAARLGADALGFVFAPSKRQVTVQQVAEITPHLPDTVERVGVFHTLDTREIVDTVHRAGLNTVQLHGGVSLDLAARLQDQLSGIRIIQTIHWVVNSEGRDSALHAQDSLRLIRNSGLADRVLVDSKIVDSKIGDSRIGDSIGGTGVPFPWDLARSVFQEEGPPRILAGGLRPDNVAEAISKLDPWGVDVVSGVESVPGRKDPDKLAAFIRIAREASPGNKTG
jgi:phosphoribosylanthranilate isomerase